MGKLRGKLSGCLSGAGMVLKDKPIKEAGSETYETTTATLILFNSTAQIDVLSA